MRPPPVNGPTVNTSTYGTCNSSSLNVADRPVSKEASLLPLDRLLTTAPAHPPGYRSKNSYSSGRQSPLEISSRSMTLPSNRSSLSDASLSQDCAFPPFPTSRSRSTAPNTPSETARSLAVHQRGQRASGDSNFTIVPIFSQGNGETGLHRMDLTVPGPVGGFRPRGHKKTPSMGSSKDFTYQRIGQNETSHTSRPSTAGSNGSPKPSLSTISKGPRSKLVHNNTNVLRLSTKYGDPVQSFATGELVPGRNGEPSQRNASIEKLRHESRSLTYPLGNPTKEENGTRRPSAPSLHMKRPSVAAAIRPLHEIGSVSTFKSSRSIKRRSNSQVALIVGESAAESTGNETGESLKIDNVPAASEIYLSSEHRAESLRHLTASPSSSSSFSRGSSKSGVGSASSTSTISLSGSPPRQKRRPSDAGHDLFMQEFRFLVQPQTKMEEPASPHDISPIFSNRWVRADPADLLASTESMTLAPSSIRDPAIHSGRSSPIMPANDSFAALPTSSNGLVASTAHLSTSTSAHLPKTHRTALSNKGRCKGCDQLIMGKSVSSADGRLTGRYHKACFTCMTCKELFRTADFYIHNNHPYCQRHYHQLNQSLCAVCDCGIEGQYIETENKQKFHQECFKCQVRCVWFFSKTIKRDKNLLNDVLFFSDKRQTNIFYKDCKNVLRDHYFEINGETYCERHAVRGTQSQHDRPELRSPQRGTGTGAQQHAERRQTRLLMMAP